MGVMVTYTFLYQPKQVFSNFPKLPPGVFFVVTPFMVFEVR